MRACRLDSRYSILLILVAAAAVHGSPPARAAEPAQRVVRVGFVDPQSPSTIVERGEMATQGTKVQEAINAAQKMISWNEPILGSFLRRSRQWSSNEGSGFSFCMAYRFYSVRRRAVRVSCGQPCACVLTVVANQGF